MSQGGGIGGVERGEGDGLARGVGAIGQIRGIFGRWPDADTLLQGGMSEGLRDWDLWYNRADIMGDDSCTDTLLGVRYSSASCYPSSSAGTLEKTNALWSSVACLP